MNPIPDLASERLVLRTLTPDDAEFILELTNDPDWLRFIGDRGIHNLEDARRYIAEGPAAMYQQFGFGLLAVVVRGTGELAGLCGLLKRSWLDHADLGFAFLPRHRREGFAYEAAEATLAHARSVLGLERILAIVTPANRASIRLLEKLGMQFEREARAPESGDEVCVYGVGSPSS